MAAFKYVGRSWGVSAQIAGEELENIEHRNGSITPQAVVDAARPEGSVLHNIFEWDNDKAAEQYRLSQAGTFIRCIVKTTETEDKKSVTYRAFVNVNPAGDTQNKQGSYINTRTALEDPVSREIILANAKREMKMFRKKYKDLAELADIFDAIDKLLEGKNDENSAA